jgi:trigger factor
MSLKIERPSPCTVTVAADIPVAEVTEEREHVVKEIARKAHIPGFRPGKAPRSVIEHRHAEMILEELKEHLLHKAWDQVQEQETVHPASPLKVKKADIEADGSFRVEAELEVFPEVTLPDVADFTPPELAV